jgi:hypothetical protein
MELEHDKREISLPDKNSYRQAYVMFNGELKLSLENSAT